ncbi:TNF receptor-associated factor 2-like [Saccoglossus kowalevskii]|uniref:TNF receptor-associated factor 2-like n=1 Tax=Saccoglossus kowalevskii TaxID=10224 RepID=A0ABM0GKW5_SACKO|nr:PREDICTED: TNF receptor-associated factor 2-like [Saccoglossus kowalevskii]
MASGYPIGIFKRTTIEDKYKCNYCRQILRQPIQTYCGHRFCKKCFDLILSRHTPPICNACKEEGSHSVLSTEECYQDKAIQRELSKYEVRCQNEGCNWTGIFKDYDETHVDECPAQVIHCIKYGCEAQVRRDALAHHLRTECDMRVIQCDYCDVQLPYKEIKMHTKECDKVPSECPNCHKQNIPRGELKLHLDANNGDCSKKIVPCEFEKVGCERKMEIGKLKEHHHEYTVQHLQLLFHYLIPFLAMVQDVNGKFGSVMSIKKTVEKQQQGIESLTTTVHDLETQVKKRLTESERTAEHPNGLLVTGLIQEQGKKIEDMGNKTKLLHSKVTTYEGIVGVLSNEVENEAEKLKEVEMSLKRERERSDALERKIKSQDRIIAMKDVALAEQDLRIQSLEMTSYDGVLVWKITDSAQKQCDAVSQRTLSIYSPCFFTSRHGYKMCARIYLNGDGMGKGNHVSLFFVIMRGTFDGLLRWPFRQKVTLMWIDQNHREHVIDAFRPDPTSNSFKRPSQDMNIASGCPLFMPLAQIHSPRHAYVKDDVAYIKIIVDNSDIN